MKGLINMSVDSSVPLGAGPGAGLPSVVGGPQTGPVPQPSAATPAVGVLQGLHPGWYGAVMGTAALGMAAYANPGGLRGTLPLAHAVGVSLVLLAVAAGLVLAVAYLARWARHPQHVSSDLAHPVLGALFSTVPGGLLVVAVAANAVSASLPVPTRRGHRHRGDPDHRGRRARAGAEPGLRLRVVHRAGAGARWSTAAGSSRRW